MEAAINRAILPAFVRVATCPKCGSSNIRREWHASQDTITNLCGCGYFWTSLPLDRLPTEKKGK
jgi:predicted RNA-binding Zn-ribbon protein involved in translation (DUF1610 family)